MYNELMIPSWMGILASLAPVLLLVSVGVAIFGVYKLKGYLVLRREEKEVEERKRQEFIKLMSKKFQDERPKR